MVSHLPLLNTSLRNIASCPILFGMVIQFIKSSYHSLKEVLAKTRSLLGSKLSQLFSGKVDETALQELEKLLYESDLGVKLAKQLTDKVRLHLQETPSLNADALTLFLKEEILALLTPKDFSSPSSHSSPLVYLIVGVNGNGKTTSVAKLAHRFQADGKKVLIAAADTFRAAAVEQLQAWAERLKVDIVKGKHESDPAAVAFDAMTAAKARGVDIAIIDTAGRLHTKTPLMQELEKIRRTIKKIFPDAPHETLLVLDATAGQNAVEQAKIFHQFTPLTGLILTKLDGTAKGGSVVAIQQTLGLPVKFIGLGEGVDDLQVFDPKTFVDALFG